MPKNTSPEDREVLKRVYEDQMREYRPRLEAAAAELAASATALGGASERYQVAAQELGAIQGKVDALIELAARDGIDLDP